MQTTLAITLLTEVADVAKPCRGCANHAGNQDPGLCHVCCNARGTCKASTTWRRHALRITPCRGWQHAGNYHRTEAVAVAKPCRGCANHASNQNPGLCHVCCNARGTCKASTTWRRHALRITPCRGWQHAGNYHRTEVVATCILAILARAAGVQTTLAIIGLKL